MTDLDPHKLSRHMTGIAGCYHHQFESVMDELFREGILGPGNQSVTESFFSLLHHAGAINGFDHALKLFFDSLSPENRWILHRPALFKDWADLAPRFGAAKTFMGIRYFEIWSRQGFGQNETDVRFAVARTRMLLDIDPGLAYHFILSYTTLRRTLSRDSICQFTDNAVLLFRNSPEQAYHFLQGKINAASAFMRNLTGYAHLEDLTMRLTKTMQAIAGEPLKIRQMNRLGAVENIRASTPPVGLADTFYFPEKISLFDAPEANTDMYRLMAAVCASAYHFRSFCRIHGRNGCRTSLDVCKRKYKGRARIINNGFICTEIFRILTRMADTFSGTRKILYRLLDHEVHRRRDAGLDQDMLYPVLLRLLSHSSETPRAGQPDPELSEQSELLGIIEEVAQKSGSFHDVLSLIAEACDDNAELFSAHFGTPVEPILFFPDYMCPGAILSSLGTSPGVDVPIERDLSSEVEHTLESPSQSDPLDDSADDAGTFGTEDITQGSGDETNEELKEASPANLFQYDEWCEDNQDYYTDWVHLVETPIQPADSIEMPLELSKEHRHITERVKQIFSTIKPDLVRKEKYLPQGDTLNMDALVGYLCTRKAGIQAPEKFYEKPLINRRSIAVAILIDLSGSTGVNLENGRSVLDLEKESALILGEGLSQIGDQFGIFGFTGQGRLNAQYYCFKSFEEEWDMDSKKALFSATPGSCTRMGVALRHTGHILGQVTAKRKVIIVITDGKPTDTDYPTHNHYAHHDVRKAVQELSKRGVAVFCISTEENQASELDIMMPRKRYVIIKSPEELPGLLSRYYLKLTT
jgi:von Willebrand factor type A domain